MKKKFSLPKAEKLKSRKTIEQLFQKGNSITLHPFRLLYSVSFSSSPASIKMGVAVSKKFFKKAVERNRIKRLLREAYRKNKLSLHEWAQQQSAEINIFIIYTSPSLPEWNWLELKVQQLLHKFIERLNETVSKHT